MYRINIRKIHFDSNLFRNQYIEFNTGQITLLTGESGCGKSTLLNMIGLIDLKSDYDIFINEQTVSKSKYSQYQKSMIGYIFQDSGIIEDITIEDNFKNYCNIAGIRFDKNKIVHILNTVELNSIELSQRAKSLSGGEKKRLAIAMVLIKDPELILFDEPTASLDMDNSNKIIQIIDELRNKGKTIVIATHNPELYSANSIYKLDEGKITVIDINKTQDVSDNIPTKRNRFNPFSYAIIYIKNHLILDAVFICLFILSIGLLIPQYQLSIEFSSIYNGVLDFIDSKEMMINTDDYSLYSDDNQYYNPYGMRFNDIEIESISNIDHINYAYGYYKIDPQDLSGGVFDALAVPFEEWNPEQIEICNQIRYDSDIYNVTDLAFGDTYQFASCKNSSMLNKCIEVDTSIDEGIFIPLSLANYLGIEKLNQTEIELAVPTIIGFIEGEAYMINEESNNMIGSDKIPVYHNAIEIETRKLLVKGIYEKTSDYQYYDSMSPLTIYVDESFFISNHEKLINNEEFMITFDALKNEYYENGIDKFNYELLPSSLILNMENPQFEDDILKDIKEIHEYVCIKTKRSSEKTINEGINNIYKTTMIQPVILFVIFILAYIVIFIYQLRSRKKELALLKANGINTISSIITLENIILSVISIPFTYLFIRIKNGQDALSATFGYTSECMIIHISIIIIVNIILSVISYLYTRKVNCCKELRSK